MVIATPPSQKIYEIKKDVEDILSLTTALFNESVAVKWPRNIILHVKHSEDSFSFNTNNTKLKIDIYIQSSLDYWNISIYFDLPGNVSSADFTKWNHKSVQNLALTWVTTTYSHLTVSVLFTGVMVILTPNYLTPSYTT